LQSGAVLGIGGSFEVNRKNRIQGMRINNFGASIAIGQVRELICRQSGSHRHHLGIPVDFNAEFSPVTPAQ